MPNFYDPANYTELQKAADEFYETSVEGHLEPLRHLNPVNLEDLGKTSPEKILKQGTRAIKLFKRLTGAGHKKGLKALEKEVKIYTEEDPSKKYRKGDKRKTKKKVEGIDGQKKTALEELENQGDLQINAENLRTVKKPMLDTLMQKILDTDYLYVQNGASGIFIYTSGTTLSDVNTPYLQLPYIPSEVEMKAGANFAKINILNRNNVPYQFINGSEEVSFTINWYATGARLGEAYQNARKLQLLSLMDGTKFPRQVFLDWGANNPLFYGHHFYVKSARIKMQQFHRAKVGVKDGKQNVLSTGYIQPSRIEQEVVLIRVEGPGYWTHLEEMSMGASGDSVYEYPGDTDSAPNYGGLY